jgi:hypothetical protein
MATRVLAADPGLQRIEHRSLAVAAAPLLGKATEAN